MFPFFFIVSILFAILEVKGKVLINGRMFLLILGIFTTIILLEDILFFVFAGVPITPGIFTTQWGYITTPISAVPIWYFLAVVISVTFFIFAEKSRK